MRLIFLDIDGVLADRASMGKCWHMRLPRVGIDKLSPVPPLSPSCVARFNRLVSLTGAKVVVCSTWGREFETEGLCQYLRDEGVRCEVVGRTPLRGVYRVRGEDIQQWLDDTDAQVDAYCILDDHNDMAHLKGRLVQTNADLGLQDRDVEAALALLA